MIKGRTEEKEEELYVKCYKSDGTGEAEIM